ncbi:hypothetical protein KAJ83_01375 [Marivibrio halodurans]|uniref:Uncharacterized protein n=1 Tax=Marivibrio halodurans TaxID=2039722 RepID=A0A8J7RYX7_9PROT|nr:hypothetical protein [Marivibrio halodurans]MBP5855643.1 hypothetical protein [Marivibrio halodurans]
MAGKQRAKFISAVWGARYIQDFCQASLPSYLAPGNLPTLGAVCDLEILILTDKASVPIFKRNPLFEDLRKICAVRFILIDDLIVKGQYGVTLTLAYARAVMDSGEAQTDTYFIFMNSDFVLSDGSLRHLGERMQAGEPCIMAPSLRGRQTELTALLREEYDPASRTLSLSSREMIRMTFDHLHPTVVAKTVTQDHITCTTTNQLYWQVDESTLLGRYYLIFMLAIKPERPMPLVTSYCDYGFVPELVPSGAFSIIDDSDSFYMLELQPTDQESESLRWGRLNPRKAIKTLAEWTTREHRAFAEIDVMFKAGDAPESLDKERANFRDFFDRFKSALRSPPREPAYHPYWVLGFQSWWQLRGEGNVSGTSGSFTPPPTIPSEMRAPAWIGKADADDILGRPSLIPKDFTWLKRFLYPSFERPPDVSHTHRARTDYEPIRRWIKSMKHAGTKGLFLHEVSSPITRPLARQSGAETLAIDEFIRDDITPNQLYSDVLIHVYLSSIGHVGSLLANVSKIVEPNGRITLFIEGSSLNSGVQEGNFQHELARFMADTFTIGLMRFDIRTAFAGGHIKHYLTIVERGARTRISVRSPLGSLKRPVFYLILAATAVLFAVDNIRKKFLRSTKPKYCTSVVLTLDFSNKQKRGMHKRHLEQGSV